MSLTVILADDHPLIRSGVEAALAGSGVDILASVGTGAEALAAIARCNPDVAILDVSMPEGTGIEVLRALRSRGDQRPVVILTAYLDDAALLAALDEGANGLVMKDDGIDELIACLDTVHQGGQHVSRELLDRAEEVRAQQASNPFKRLNAREAELAWMVGQGMRNREISERVGVSEGAVKFALHAVYRKLGVATRTELALLLGRHDLT